VNILTKAKLIKFYTIRDLRMEGNMPIPRKTAQTGQAIYRRVAE